MPVQAPCIAYPADDASGREDYLTTGVELFSSQRSIVDAALQRCPDDVVAGLRQLDARLDSRLLSFPRRRSAHAELAEALAARLFDAPNPVSIYEKGLVELRAAIMNHRRRDARDALKAHEEREARKWSHNVVAQGPWDQVTDPASYEGPPALPMPVQLSPMESFVPFFKHIDQAGDDQNGQDGSKHGTEPIYDVHLLEFERGVLYSDGRMDLCKQVIGPHNIRALMDALRNNTFIKHFLFGNNVVGPVGARAIADFISDCPDRIETWYLAGNCISTDDLGVLVDAWVKSASITNIWLKRNPLGPAAAEHLFRLVVGAKNLRTLDLDQTQLGDVGTARLFTLLDEHLQNQGPPALEHVYLNANGLGPLTMSALSKYLSRPSCRLRSLYLSMNPIGSSLPLLCPGVAASTSLYRLTLSSCGLTTDSVTPLLSAVSSHSSLQVLDLGQSFATLDLSARFNWFDDTLVPQLLSFLQSSPRLLCLSLSLVPMTDGGPLFSNYGGGLERYDPDFDAEASLGGVSALFRAVASHPALQYFDAKSLYPSNMVRAPPRPSATWLAKEVRASARGRLEENVRREHGMGYGEWLGSEKRFLLSPRDVRFIDSVYRNRDAGRARRGELVLEKHWKEGDGVLEEVRRAGEMLASEHRGEKDIS